MSYEKLLEDATKNAMGDWQSKFVISIARQTVLSWFYISERQLEKLKEIAEDEHDIPLFGYEDEEE